MASPSRTSSPERSRSVRASGVACTEVTLDGKRRPARGVTAVTALRRSPVTVAPGASVAAPCGDPDPRQLGLLARLHPRHDASARGDDVGGGALADHARPGARARRERSSVCGKARSKLADATVGTDSTALRAAARSTASRLSPSVSASARSTCFASAGDAPSTLTVADGEHRRLARRDVGERRSGEQREGEQRASGPRGRATPGRGGRSGSGAGTGRRRSPRARGDADPCLLAPRRPRDRVRRGPRASYIGGGQRRIDPAPCARTAISVDVDRRRAARPRARARRRTAHARGGAIRPSAPGSRPSSRRRRSR